MNHPQNYERILRPKNGNAAATILLRSDEILSNSWLLGQTAWSPILAEAMATMEFERGYATIRQHYWWRHNSRSIRHHLSCHASHVNVQAQQGMASVYRVIGKNGH